jgi:NAD(P)-dependent dehydrogenase (short-subunit alcohol dehydrogenase family)
MLNRFTGTEERKAGLAATVPLKRVGRPEEIAQTIMFLASPSELSTKKADTSHCFREVEPHER